MRLSQHKQPQKLLKKKDSWCEVTKKDSVMWNRVGVKYDSVWPAPAPNIRCPFFVHHIHPPLLRLLLLLLAYFVTYYNYHKYSSSSTSAADLLLITLVYDSSSPSTYFTYSPPYFLLPPATYPLQQLLVPVHHPYSFTNHLPHRRDLLQQQHPWLLLPLPQLWQVPQLLVILPVPLILLLVTLVYDSSSSSTTTPEGLPPLLSIVPLHTSPAVYPTPSTSTYFTSMSSTSTYLIPHLQFYYDYLDYHQRRAACQTSKPYSDCE